jgi:hypothetical protein
MIPEGMCNHLQITSCNNVVGLQQEPHGFHCTAKFESLFVAALRQKKIFRSDADVLEAASYILGYGRRRTELPRSITKQ